MHALPITHKRMAKSCAHNRDWWEKKAPKRRRGSECNSGEVATRCYSWVGVFSLADQNTKFMARPVRNGEDHTAFFGNRFIEDKSQAHSRETSLRAGKRHCEQVRHLTMMEGTAALRKFELAAAFGFCFRSGLLGGSWRIDVCDWLRRTRKSSTGDTRSWA